MTPSGAQEKITARPLWYLNRLKCMSIEEVAFRTRQRISLWSEKRHLRVAANGRFPLPLVVRTSRWIAVDGSGCNEKRYLAAADRILEGHLTVFRIEADTNEVIRSWNTNPKSRTPAALIFGKTLDYRNESFVGDIKYLWEPNRHLHLVPLAQAYAISRKPIYLQAIRLHLETWLDQCPYPLGPNWSSSLELAIRLINWSMVWQLIGGSSAELFSGAQGKALRSNWLAGIYRHIDFIAGHLSRYSSANNHLIGEAAGLFIAALTWPFWADKTSQWRRMGHEILCAEALKQIHPDGITREQSLAYQQFVLDFLIFAMLAGQAEGMAFPATYRQRIIKMLAFIAAMMDVSGNLPMIGDADDGFVARLSQEESFCPYRSLLATGAFVFDCPDFLCAAGRVDDKTRWLLGPVPPVSSGRDRKDPIVIRSFPESGYYLLGSGWGTPEEIRCLIDCGPLGYLSLAAHGHADALAIYLSVGGREFLIDPGTYCYHTQKKWREYFRGTAAHNTVRVDGLSQSESGGSFMWLHQARAYTAAFSSSARQDHFAGYHDGYRRLDDPVIHRRAVTFDKFNRIITVVDTIKCRRSHLVERFWHFHEHCQVASSGHLLTAEHDGTQIILSADDIAEPPMIYQGNPDQPAGWVSRQYDLKIPTTTAVMQNTVVGTATLQTDIRILI